MTYDDALAFWYERINYEVRSAKPGDLKLELHARASAPARRSARAAVRLVHVTGTKGKGSTCAMLASVLQAAGYRVGLFTSPHLTHVEERMQVNRAPISPAELTALMDDVAPAVRAMEADAKYPSPTFFEIGTALGFLHFVRRRCEVAVIEVGLGGRFDSTNVCRPLVSVITNVGFDHLAQLGHTLEAIAYQKAGIIKRHVPVVSGVVQPGPREVVRQVAAEMDAPLWEVDRPPTPLAASGRPTPPAPLPVGRGAKDLRSSAAIEDAQEATPALTPSLQGGGLGGGSSRCAPARERRARVLHHRAPSRSGNVHFRHRARARVGGSEVAGADRTRLDRSDGHPRHGAQRPECRGAGGHASRVLPGVGAQARGVRGVVG